MARCRAFGSKKAGRKSFLDKKVEKPDALAEYSDAERAEILAYRERNKNESKRFRSATDSEFWLALCFEDRAALDQWRDVFGFGALHERVLGADAVDLLAPWMPEKPKRGFGGSKSGKVAGFMKAAVEDPLAGIEYTNNVEQDSLLELEALHAALQTASAPDDLKNVTDSDVWFVIIFGDRAEKDKFLADFNLWQVGDKYVDGARVARILRSDYAQ